jgi:undecaprenyl-diphosphatase
MTLLQSIILGIIQGATEFLPISSSGHLVIVPFVFGWEIPNGEAFIFDVLVQVATLTAVFAYFWREIGLIFPAIVLGLLLKGQITRAFENPLTSAIGLLVTAGLLVVAERVGKRQRRMKNLTWIDSLMIGLFQVLALFPGISRSGSTITGGMVRDLKRPPAARFAFLMSIPVMIAAGTLAALDLLAHPNTLSLLPTYFPGFFAAAFVGYLAIRWLIKYLAKHSLYVFAVYCTLLSIITIILVLIRN